MKLPSILQTLPTPAIVVELDIAARNIKKMVVEAQNAHLQHRPHIKTHRASYFAKLQLEAGCHGITAAKLGEAEVMADAGIDDILLAYPLIGEDKCARLFALAQRITITTIVNSVVGAKQLSDYFAQRDSRIDVLIEIDGGLNRGGVACGEAALAFAQDIKDFTGINIKGLLYYGGLVYNSHNLAEIKAFSIKERDELCTTAALLRKAGFCMDVCSAGSSFTGKTPQLLSGISEIRSGHYIFNDCGQLDVALAQEEDCALWVVTTVVCKPDNHVVICDVGTKSITSDLCHYRAGYGYVIGHPEVEIYALNEEHAFLRTTEENPLQIGDKIAFIPNHACVVTNLAGSVYGVRGDVLECMIPIDAQGKSV